MKTFAMLGLAVGGGFLIGKYQRDVLKYAVRGTLAAGSRLREIQEEIAEDIEDQVAEEKARAEQRTNMHRVG